MKKTEKMLIKFIQYFLLILLSVICIIPFYIMIINSTRTNAQISVAVSFLPGTNLIQNIKSLNKTISMMVSLKNSILISLPSTLLSGYFGTMAAYGFSKFRFRGSKAMFAIALATMMIPTQLSLLGIYQASAKMKLLNTYWPIILPSVANTATLFWLRQYIESTIDDGFIEAARIDGYSEIGIFHNIIIPLSRVGLFTISIFNFVHVWNDYISPVMFISRNAKVPLSVAIAIVKAADYQDQGAIYAGVTISVLPILVVYLFLNSKITGGLTAGGIKG
ncbi:MAG: carbohydrate ABC transporter permease [Bacillota bacterium]|jgi:multiple sugar transport system permease protein|nr:carbohydrate ABC transporter permease [Bacillota bacterium]NLV64044.1 carbohydrate ABC transporter permease [Clostridiaceae bacterium]